MSRDTTEAYPSRCLETKQIKLFVATYLGTNSSRVVKVTFRRDLPGFDPKQQKNLGWNETHDQSSQKEKTIRYNIMLVCTAIIWLASEVRA